MFIAIELMKLFAAMPAETMGSSINAFTQEGDLLTSARTPLASFEFGSSSSYLPHMYRYPKKIFVLVNLDPL